MRERLVLDVRCALLALLLLASIAQAAPVIEAIVLKQAYGVGLNNMITLRYDAVVLYTDGGYATDLAKALSANPPIAGHWRKSGDNYVLTDRAGKTTQVPTKMAARAAAPGQTLSGEYRDLGGVGSASDSAVAVVAWKNMRFSADGSVVMGQGAGAFSGNSEATAGDTRVVTTGSRSGTARYRLDGWTITLTHADGRSERRLFYLFPDSDNSIGVGATTLNKRRGSERPSAQPFRAGDAPPANVLETNRLARDFGRDPSFRAGLNGKATAGAPASVSFDERGASTTPAKLAQQYPPAARAETETLFRELLAKYPKVEQQYGLPPRDLGGAVAMFIAGSYSAYHNYTVQPDEFRALAAQMRRIVAGHPVIAAADNQTKREFYEQMAILGAMLGAIQEGLAKRPNTPNAAAILANIRQAGKGYLEQFLDTQAERVKLNASGVSVR